MSFVRIAAPAVALLSISCQRTAKRPAGDRWLQIATRDTMVFALDTQAIVRSDTSTYRAWVRVKFKKDQAGSAFDEYKLYRSEVDRMVFDCDRLRMSRRLTAYYDSSGQHLGEQLQDSAWTEALPSSVGEMIADTTCRIGRSRNLRISP